MLKRRSVSTPVSVPDQPPSGGCVLKHLQRLTLPGKMGSAAFGRLCVETGVKLEDHLNGLSAAFGRLCVETSYKTAEVEEEGVSRLRAAVC